MCASDATNGPITLSPLIGAALEAVVAAAIAGTAAGQVRAVAAQVVVVVYYTMY